jgi:hypothetical protein
MERLTTARGGRSSLPESECRRGAAGGGPPPFRRQLHQNRYQLGAPGCECAGRPVPGSGADGTRAALTIRLTATSRPSKTRNCLRVTRSPQGTSLASAHRAGDQRSCRPGRRAGGLTDADRRLLHGSRRVGHSPSSAGRQTALMQAACGQAASAVTGTWRGYGQAGRSGRSQRARRGVRSSRRRVVTAGCRGG